MWSGCVYYVACGFTCAVQCFYTFETNMYILVKIALASLVFFFVYIVVVNTHFKFSCRRYVKISEDCKLFILNVASMYIVVMSQKSIFNNCVH